jgi:hypothetical protein
MQSRASTFLLAVLLAALAAACGSEPGRHDDPAGSGDYLLKGRVLDAGTGEPVSREKMHLHFFCDEIDHQVTLDPDDTSDYAVRMPRPTIRVRAADGTDTYHLLETTLRLEASAREFDIELRPTGFVLLRGRVIDASTGKAILPTRGMGAGPRLYLRCEEPSWAGGSFVPEPDGTFSLKAPRAVIEVAAVNTAMGVRTKRIDLTGVTAAEHAIEIVLE